MTADTRSFLITKDFSIKQAMKRMSEIGQRNIFIVDSRNRLVASLSDGDIRKWILSGGSLRECVSKAYHKKSRFVSEGDHPDRVKKMMLEYLIECVPVLKNGNEVVRVLTWKDVFLEKPIRQKKPVDIQVVIMAGGKGSRLDPFTTILPKALIPIGDKPIIEIIMDKFGEYGIREFFISVNHKSRMIKSYFEEKNGGKYRIRYIEEKEPLGTAGSLKLLRNKVKEPFLVTNCDIIVEADCGEIVNFHEENNYDLTLVVSCKHYLIPYGVCAIENGGLLKDINEKPEYDLLVNTGMYIMKKNIIDLIPGGRVFNINELIIKAKEKGLRTGVFPINDSAWLDIGQWEEYHKAIEKMRIE